MNSISSLSCITCSPKSNMRSTRCSSLTRKCVHKEIILVNSRMKIPFHVLSTNHMPPRKWTFYKENHRKKKAPFCWASSSPSVIQSPQAAFRGREGSGPRRWRIAAPVLALLLTSYGIWAPFPPLSSVSCLSLSFPHLSSEGWTPELRVPPANPRGSIATVFSHLLP